MEALDISKEMFYDFSVNQVEYAALVYYWKGGYHNRFQA